MKVYYEKPNGFELVKTVIELAAKYENLTGKAPNKIEMTKEERDAIAAYLCHFRTLNTGKQFKEQVCGMEIIIND